MADKVGLRDCESKFLCSCSLFFPLQPKRQREDVANDTPLAELCVGDYAPLKKYFSELLARNLIGKTEAGWEQAVESRGGPWQLVSGWFETYDMWRYLKGYVERQVPETPLKKRGKDGGESSSPAGEVRNLYDALRACRVDSGSLVAAPEGFDWPCGLEKGKKLYVRECYAPFFEAAVVIEKKKFAGCIFTGNPGIGKSVWLNYAVVRFLQVGRRVVLQRAGKKGYWLFSEASCCREKGELPDLDSKRWKDVVYLFDPDENDSSPVAADVFTIVATSPQQKHYKGLQKLPRGVERLYFPCWTLDELRVVAVEHDLERPLEELWLLWGGIPRYVFSRNQPFWRGMLDGYIGTMDFKLVEWYKGSPEIPEQHQKQLSHMVVQYRVESPFTSPLIDFASPEIGVRVIQAAAETRYTDLIAHYERARRKQWQGPYTGHLWEHLCHVIISRGTAGGLTLEPLGSPGNMRHIVKEELTVVRGKLEELNALKEGVYFQPFAANFAVIDAATRIGNAIFGFQSTLAESHAPTGARVLELVKALPKGTHLNLVWVVDPAKNGEFEQQNIVGLDGIAKKDRKLLQTVKQWRLTLKFPRDSPFLKG